MPGKSNNYGFTIFSPTWKIYDARGKKLILVSQYFLPKQGRCMMPGGKNFISLFFLQNREGIWCQEKNYPCFALFFFPKQGRYMMPGGKLYLVSLFLFASGKINYARGKLIFVSLCISHQREDTWCNREKVSTVFVQNREDIWCP